MASPRIIGSLMRTAMPPSSALAAPTPMNQVPSVAMNDGIRSLTWMTPLTKPIARADQRARRATPRSP